LCEVNNVRKNLVDSEKTSQSQKGVRNMGTLRYLNTGTMYVNRLRTGSQMSAFPKKPHKKRGLKKQARRSGNKLQRVTFKTQRLDFRIVFYVYFLQPGSWTV
jgi:hypothetical protein